MNDTQSKHGVLRTFRFDIHSHEIRRDDRVGLPRLVFQAWFHSADVPKPVCIVTIFERENFVEWMHVDEQHRRDGIATEVLQAIEAAIGELWTVGTTEAGEAFCEEYEFLRKHHHHRGDQR